MISTSTLHQREPQRINTQHMPGQWRYIHFICYNGVYYTSLRIDLLLLLLSWQLLQKHAKAFKLHRIDYSPLCLTTLKKIAINFHKQVIKLSMILLIDFFFTDGTLTGVVLVILTQHKAQKSALTFHGRLDLQLEIGIDNALIKL